MRTELSKMIEHGESRARIVIEGVTPEIDSGCFPIKRIVGDKVVVEADIFADGHDVLSAALLYRKESTPNWTEVPMKFLVNDRWRGSLWSPSWGTIGIPSLPGWTVSRLGSRI
ncbi:MAG: DUF3416 domain-containing protein [Dehalococcoidia bacterium]|nr:MAG: DUF3416 domain-containing protein [Dehalococcoidia bacterium]